MVRLRERYVIMERLNNSMLSIMSSRENQIALVIVSLVCLSGLSSPTGVFDWALAAVRYAIIGLVAGIPAVGPQVAGVFAFLLAVVILALLMRVFAAIVTGVMDRISSVQVTTSPPVAE